MSVFKASAARPHHYEDEPRICFSCLTECESTERYKDLVRCPDCKREEDKMDSENPWNHRDLTSTSREIA